MNWFDKNKFFEKLLILTWIVFLFSCLFLLSFTSHAEEAYFPMNQNENGHFTETQKALIDSYFDTENNYVFVRYQGTYSTYTGCYVLYYPKTNTNGVYAEILSNGYQFSLYYSGSVTGATVTNARLNNNGTVNNFSTTFAYAFQNLNSSSYDSSCDYMSNFIVYNNNNPDTQTKVLKYGPDPTPGDLGLPVPPDFTGLDPGWIGAGAADVVTPPASVPPSITINNYTWTTNNPPSFDSSSIEAAIESVGEIITYQANWLSTNLSGEFSNLGTNLKNLVDYIGKTIQYFGDLIIKNIQNGIQNLYDNLEALVKPILDKVAYITEPIDSAVIYDSYSSTSFNSDVTSVKTNFTTFVNQFNNIQEPTTYKIPIHFESITMFAEVGTQYIQLDWLNSVKTLLRSFLWMVTTYGLLASIFDAIPKYINGGGDESD